MLVKSYLGLLFLIYRESLWGYLRYNLDNDVDDVFLFNVIMSFDSFI